MEYLLVKTIHYLIIKFEIILLEIISCINIHHIGVFQPIEINYNEFKFNFFKDQSKLFFS